MSWRTRWKIAEFVRNSLWIVPGLSVTLAMILGLLLPEIDRNTESSIGVTFGEGAAESILSSLASGMITFTGFVFSILLLAVQFGSSQFSPRMLRRFLRDPTTKIALGMFMATFIYAFAVLRTVSPSDDENFIPDFSVSVSLLMLLISMMLFLRLISRTTHGLRVAAVLRDLGRDGSKVLNRIYPDPVIDEPQPKLRPAESAGSLTRTIDFSQESGVLQSVDRNGLLRMATEADVLIELVPPIGDLLLPHTPLFRIHGNASEIDDDELRNSVAVGDERTMKQDPAFVFRLLADISAKALSPGVNDPTTSIQALDQIELLLVLLGTRQLSGGVVVDEHGVERLHVPATTWEDFLSIALDETRMFGETSVQIPRRIRALLEDVHRAVPEFRKPAVEAQIELLEWSVERSFGSPEERTSANFPDRQGIGSTRSTQIKTRPSGGA